MAFTAAFRNGNLVRNENGDSAIEMAVTLPVLFTLVFCFMELCLMLYTRNMVSEYAREGTRYAMVHGASCPNSSNPTCEVSATQVNNYVSAIGWPNLGQGTLTVNTSYCQTATSCSSSGSEAVGNMVQVKVTYVFPINMPFVPRNAMTISSTSQTYIIQ